VTLPELDYDETGLAGIHDDPDAPDSFDPADGVEVRAAHHGVAHYAVFDEGKQVSDTAGPLNEQYVLAFVEGY
jgi:hypothetical protein